MSSADNPIGASRLKQALALRSATQNVAVFTLDRAGRVNSWNPDAEKVEGYTAEEVLGRHLSVFYPPEYDAEYPDSELAHAAEEGVHVDEGWRVHRDGTRFWAYVVIAAQRDVRGEVIGFIKVVRDDTAIHLRQERSEQRFSDLVEIAPIGIGLLDEDDRFQEVNAALCTLTGYSRTELTGMRAEELLPVAEQANRLDASASGTNLRTLERRDGTEVTCEISHVTSPQDDGRRYRLVVLNDVTARVHEAENLEYQATHDPQTGLLNRRGVEPLLTEATTGTAVLLCDLDNFKRINEAFGRDAGDELMRQVARTLSEAELPGCTVAHLSGDEFLIICPDVSKAGGLAALADTASRVFRMMTTVRGMPVQLTASVGATMPPRDGVRGADLLRYAEAAMYQAKERGQKKVVLAGAELDAQVQLEGDLMVALRTDGLELYYQPIVDADGTVTTAEALVRWPHPVRGVLSPAVIMPMVEQTGMTGELDRWVLHTALRQAREWPETAKGPIRVSVNLSPGAAGDPDFLHSVAEAVTKMNFPPERLVVEVTETALVELSTATLQAFQHLIDLGVTVAIDDFGAGYSSLARLKSLPAATIKLDRQFVAGIEDDEVDRAIIRSTVDMAHATHRRCIVEGVETEVQFRMLEELGVDAFQGFLFSRPLSNTNFRAYVGPPLQR